MRPAVEPATLKAVVNALSDDRLRALVIELARNGAAERSRRGWPLGKPRGRRDRPPEARAAAVIAESKHEPSRPPTAKVVVDPKLAARPKREAERLRAKRAAARRAKASSSNGNGGAEIMPAQRFWRHAEALAPKNPWRAVVREFDVNEAQAKDCCRNAILPPGMTGSAIERFLELPA